MRAHTPPHVRPNRRRQRRRSTRRIVVAVDRRGRRRRRHRRRREALGEGTGSGSGVATPRDRAARLNTPPPPRRGRRRRRLAAAQRVVAARPRKRRARPPAPRRRRRVNAATGVGQPALRDGTRQAAMLGCRHADAANETNSRGARVQRRRRKRRGERTRRWLDEGYVPVSRRDVWREDLRAGGRALLGPEWHGYHLERGAKSVGRRARRPQTCSIARTNRSPVIDWTPVAARARRSAASRRSCAPRAAAPLHEGRQVCRAAEEEPSPRHETANGMGTQHVAAQPRRCAALSPRMRRRRRPHRPCRDRRRTAAPAVAVAAATGAAPAAGLQPPRALDEAVQALVDGRGRPRVAQCASVSGSSASARRCASTSHVRRRRDDAPVADPGCTSGGSDVATKGSAENQVPVRLHRDGSAPFRRAAAAPTRSASPPPSPSVARMAGTNGSRREARDFVHHPFVIPEERCEVPASAAARSASAASTRAEPRRVPRVRVGRPGTCMSR